MWEFIFVNCAVIAVVLFAAFNCVVYCVWQCITGGEITW